ncbi:MAG TPA: glycoside hydrolase family 3 C-terminal domain-containing protein [Polyangiales bacterium]|nr:glycoside hydrolase family 3 C-terminal domain-containing protein [Polyangiales bacterium]
MKAHTLLLVACASLAACSSEGNQVGPQTDVAGHGGAGGAGGSTPAPQPTAGMRADALLAQLTLDEKLQLVRGWGLCGWAFGDQGAGRRGAGFIPGIPRLNIPDLNMTDGGAGVADCSSASAPFSPRDRPYATALPAPLAVAATWDTELADRVGAWIANEARAQGFNMLLGGSIGLIRDPRLGRAFEYMGEDPVLSGLMVSPKIRGAQSKHIVMSLKHFAANQQETQRMAANSVIEPRPLRELYLRHFEMAVKDAKPGSVMCSYNKLNGDWACENAWLLNTVLKGEWGFEGWVQSDWGATHSTVQAALSGLDEEEYSPNYFADPLAAAVADGSVPMSRLDDMVRRKLVTLIDTGVLDDPPMQQTIDFAAGETFAQQVAGRAMVLLRNRDDLLPLPKTTMRVAVIGAHADSAMLSGGGSSQVLSPGGPAYAFPTKDGQKCPEQPGAGNWCEIWIRSAPQVAIQGKVPTANVRFADGKDVAAAAALASDSEVAVLLAHQWAGEEHDLTSLTLRDDQDALIAAVATANPKTIVVLQTGNPTLMPWLSQVGAVIQAWYPGIGGAGALADILFGDVNPSGKLPVSFPAKETETPTGGAAFSTTDVPYTEGLQIGYRWYDAMGIAPLFPFGHGLSYTGYTYADLAVTPGGGQLSFSVTNSGTRAGTEVAQIYASLPTGAGDAPKRLVGWKTVTLAPGETQQLSLMIPGERYTYWDTTSSSWKTPAGSYQIMVGASAGDIRLKSAFEMP